MNTLRQYSQKSIHMQLYTNTYMYQIKQEGIKTQQETMFRFQMSQCISKEIPTRKGIMRPHMMKLQLCLLEMVECHHFSETVLLHNTYHKICHQTSTSRTTKRRSLGSGSWLTVTPCFMTRVARHTEIRERRNLPFKISAQRWGTTRGTTKRGTTP